MEAGYSETFNKAMQILARRSQSVKTLREKLARYDFAQEHIEGSLARLIELGYLNDEEYARSLIQRYHNKGDYFIQNKLAEKGVDRELFTRLKSCLDSEYERALHLATSKQKKFLKKENQSKQIAQYLAYRGFNPETCWKVARDFQNQN